MALERTVGPLSDPVGARLLEMALASRQASTTTNYNDKWARFTSFCALENRVPLPASADTVFRYLGFLSLEGRVQASSLGVYLSAINAVHSDLGLSLPVAEDTRLLSSLRRGYAALHPSASAPTAQPVAFPAPLVWEILQLGLTATSLPLLRACTAVVVAWVTFGRADTVVSLAPDGIGIDRTAPSEALPCTVCGSPDDATIPILLCDRCQRGFHLSCLDPPLSVLPEADDWHCSPCRLRPHDPHPLGPSGCTSLWWREARRKGHNTDPSRRVLRLDLRGCYDLAVLLDRYCSRAAWPAPAHGRRQSFWQLPGERAPPRGSHLSDWLTMCLKLVPASHGSTYTAHSLRRGGASAALALHVPLERIEFHGGWSRSSTALRKHYLDLTMGPSAAARALLAGLLVDG